MEASSPRLRPDPVRLAAVLATALVHALLLAVLLREPAIEAPAKATAEPLRIEIEFMRHPPQAPTMRPPLPAVDAVARSRLRAPPRSVNVPLREMQEHPAAEPPTVLDLSLPGDWERPRLAPRDILRPPSARLPGREEAYVDGIVMRERMSPQQIVNFIGALFFGGGYDPCPDLRSRLASATSNDERMDLVHRARRQRCG